MSEGAPPALLELTTHVVGAGVAGHDVIESSYQARRAAARATSAWAGGDDAVAVVAPLPDPERLRSATARAASIGTDLLIVMRHGGERLGAFAPTREWTIGTSVAKLPDLRSVGQAVHDGGIVLNCAERWDSRTADFADDLALAFDANVRVACVLGRAVVGQLGEGYWTDPAVLALEGTVVVDVDGDGSPVEIEQGTGRRVRGAREVDASDGVALVVGLRSPLLADLWGHVIDTVPFWPRVRLDLPIHPDRHAEVYGIDGPVDVIGLIRDLLEEQFLDRAAAERALAWWRANLVPTPRAPRLGRAAGPAVSTRGVLPGGFGFVDVPMSDAVTVRAAAGAWTFDVPDGSEELMATLVSGTGVDRHDLVGRDADFLDLVLGLGLATDDPV